MTANLPGRATHFKAGLSTACGLAGTLLKTDDLGKVDCRRCRKSKAFGKTRLKNSLAQIGRGRI